MPEIDQRQKLKNAINALTQEGWDSFPPHVRGVLLLLKESLNDPSWEEKLTPDQRKFVEDFLGVARQTTDEGGSSSH